MHSICRGIQTKTKAKPKINKSKNFPKPNSSSAPVASPSCQQSCLRTKWHRGRFAPSHRLSLAPILSLGSLAWGLCIRLPFECSQGRSYLISHGWHLLTDWLYFGGDLYFQGPIINRCDILVLLLWHWGESVPSSSKSPGLSKQKV